MLDRVHEPVRLALGGRGLLGDRPIVGEDVDLLQPQAQAGERAAQLVRGVGGELALGAQEIGDAGVGGGQRPLDRVDLGHAADLVLGGEARMADAGGAAGEPLEWPREPPRLHRASTTAATTASSESRPTASQTVPTRSVLSSPGATATTRRKPALPSAGTRKPPPSMRSPPETTRPFRSVTSSRWPRRGDLREQRGVDSATGGALGRQPRGRPVGLALEALVRRLAQELRADDAERHAEQQHRREAISAVERTSRRRSAGGGRSSASASKRKPTPRTVVMRARVSPSLRRSHADVHVERLRRAPPVLVPDAAISSSRRTTAPASRTSTARRSNSFGASSTRGRRATPAAPPGRRARPRLGRPVAVRAPAAQQRPHARGEVGERERLGDVVVGAGVEPEHLVELRAARGEHEHRRPRLALVQPAADLDPVDAGQAEVEHDDLERRRRPPPAARPRRCPRLDVVPLALERPHERIGDRGVVLHHEQSAMAGQATETWNTFAEPCRGLARRLRGPSGTLGA